MNEHTQTGIYDLAQTPSGEITKATLGHIPDTGVRCFGAIRVVIKWSSLVKAHLQHRKLFTNIEKYSSTEKHSVLHKDHPLDYFYEPHHGVP